MTVKNAINPVKFESDLLKTNEDKALQSHRFYRCLYGGRPVPCSSPNFATLWRNIFALFGHITFKLGKFPYFNALFTEVLVDISL